MKDIAKKDKKVAKGKQLSEYLKKRLSQFISPLRQRLDDALDRRLVSTFVLTLQCIIRHRHRQQGLLLSELGEYILSPEQAPAGTKRLSNLLRSPKWSFLEVVEFLLEEAKKMFCQLKDRGERCLLLWDESVVEKPESWAVEGLCAVRSSKSKRLTRIKPGYYLPPLSGTVHVPGFHWLGVLMCGLQGLPQLCRMQWWTHRGEHASELKLERENLLRELAQHFAGVVHVFDRGYAGAPWLGQLFEQQVDFILRWNKSYFLLDEKGQEKKAWQLVNGKKNKGGKPIWDARRKKQRYLQMTYVPMFHPLYPDKALFLVVSRPGKGMQPWYLLTNLPIQCNADAWFVIHAYARRWEIEGAWRFQKSELAMESPRLWFWENRLKFMAMVSLVYAFLLHLLSKLTHTFIQLILNTWCHRTGERHRLATMPLYRLRLALSHLWNFSLSQNSG